MVFEIVLATRNKHKISEIKDIIGDIGIKILTLLELNISSDISETGKTLYENALLKATFVAKLAQKYSLAEDTGLEVEYLNGAPGVFSARFAGEGCTYEDNNRKLLSLLNGVPYENRRARFICVAVVCAPDGKVWSEEGVITGYISFEPRGNNGFGYDPVFIVPEYGKTFAELGPEIKNKISHRAISFNKIKQILLRL